LFRYPLCCSVGELLHYILLYWNHLISLLKKVLIQLKPLVIPLMFPYPTLIKY